RRLNLILFSCASSVVSIAYFPDFVHIAFIAPAFFVAASENLEWLCRRMAGSGWRMRVPGLPAPLAWVAGLALLALAGVRLQEVMVRLRSAYPFAHATAFGRIDFGAVADVR